MDELEEMITEGDESFAKEETGEDITHQTEETDYSDELRRLNGEFPEVSLDEESERYRELRSLGLTPREAYFASASRAPKPDTRSHLTAGVPRMARSPMGAMSRRELEEARELFSGLSDRQIEDLYRKVTK